MSRRFRKPQQNRAEQIVAVVGIGLILLVALALLLTFPWWGALALFIWFAKWSDKTTRKYSRPSARRW